MTKLPLHTPDKTDKNIAAIAALFPNTLTERITGYNEDGSAIIEHAIDFDMLRQELSNVLVEGSEERYTFNWPDKRQSVLLANMTNYKTLRPCREESVNFDATENLYIEGDNIEVLKLLQETYLGKVKMIYIDPPYNTGKDAFVYDDDFSENIAEYNEDSGDFDEDGYRMYQNLSTNGRFHTDWLNMIYPRLKVAKDLLKDDGVIFISIDDNEVHNLRKICDEVFGAWNFVCQLIWERAFSPKNDAKYVSNSHDYVLMYAKNLESFSIGKLDRTEEMESRYKNPDNDPRGNWTSGDLSVKTYNVNTDYEIVTPSGRKVNPPHGACWRVSKERFTELVADNRIWFGENGDNVPRLKRFLSEVQDGMTPTSILFYKDVGHSQEGRQELKQLFDGKGYFDGPKPVRLLHHLLAIANTGKNDIILDFFSGSATTAHAVMQLNAEDGGNRKFIMAQLPEVCDEKSEAFKAGYKSICDIGKERIRRAGSKIVKERSEINRELRNALKDNQLTLHADFVPAEGSEQQKQIAEQWIKATKFDYGFRVLKVDSTNMKDVYYEPEEITQTMLDGSIDNIKDDRTPEDLLFQVMLDLGVLLSSKIESEVVGGKNVFTVYNGGECYLIACFDAGVTAEVVTAIAKRQPYYAVFRDSGMASDSLMTSFEQIFEAYSKSTIRRVL